MQNELETAIEALKKVLSEQEKKVCETKTTINNLAQMLGKPPIYSDAGQTSSSPISNIQSDTFYGKTVIVAVREYLEMRKSSGEGPASIKEIFEALKRGGFIFNSKSDSNSMIVLRNAISKASSIFHKLPTGDYGLVKWYDLAKIKRAKGNIDVSNDSEVEAEIKTSDPQEEEPDDSQVNDESSDE